MENKTVKGYKVFNPDWTCRNFKYEVGKTYKHDGNIRLCESGFHFCIDATDCFNYYRFDSENKVAKVVATGLVKTGDDKSVTNEITIVRELEWYEVLKLVNTGKENSGYWNSGYGNSGDRNSGYWNSGYWNSGDRNSGYWNSGYWNSGNRNSGDWNSGDWNSGYGNSGNRNSGDWNSGNRNSGYGNSGDWNSGYGNNGVFCTGENTIKIFDEDTNMTLEDWRRTKAARILDNNFTLAEWVRLENMTNEEKKQHPTYETTGGYLRVFSFKEACKNMWDRLTDEEKEIVKAIPNFDENKFKEITGIQI